MRWRVEISERSGDDRLLRDALEAISIRLQEEDGKPFLAGDAFEEFETAAEVHKFACHVQSVLAEIGRAETDMAVSLQIGSVVVEKLTDGGLRKHSFLYARGASFSFGAGHVTLTVKRGGPALSDEERRRIDEQQKELAYQEKRRKVTVRFLAALKDESALQVQRLLHKELTPTTMWNIWGLIGKDMGGAIKDLVSKNQQTRFKRSVNHPDVHGEQARHLVSRQQPPSKPMNLEEERIFIRDLASRWLEKKAAS